MFRQFGYIIKRELTDQLRNPVEVRALTVFHIIFALLTQAVYKDLGEGEVGIQNRRGACLFLAMMVGFSSIQSSLFLFSA